MSGITVTRAGGRLLASKHGHGDDEPRRRHEAELLARIDHPGVVPLVGLVEGPPVELQLGFVGPDTWATRRPGGPDAVITALASVSATVADLHDLGVAHRTLSPDHVLVAPDGRPVLCGFADAGPADDASSFADLHGLAELIEHMAHDVTGELASRLRDLAHRASGGGLTARALVRELDDLCATPPTRAPRRPRRPRPKLLQGRPAAVIAPIAVVAVATAGWWLTRPPGAAGDAHPVDTAPPTTVTPVRSSTSSSTTTTTGTPPSPPRESKAADPGTTESTILEYEGRRYGVADADVTVLGDWTCDSIATPAVLDTDSGVVALFGAWPEPGGFLEPVLTTIVDHASDLRIDAGATCDQLRVLHRDGSTLVTVPRQ